MKVGILTLQSGYNYGGSLQCEALSRALEKMSHDVEVINYQPSRRPQKRFWQGWGILGGNRVANVRRRFMQLVHLDSYEKHYDVYKATQLRLTEPCVAGGETVEISKRFDVLVVGSDQVWNLEYHDDKTFYFELPADCEVKRISYAACCGKDTGRAYPWVGQLLQQFDAISVRDSFTEDWVKKQEGCEGAEVELVADPTLLHDFDLQHVQFKEKPGKYILVYAIGEGRAEFHETALKAIKEKHGDIPVILAMATGYKIQFFPWVDRILWDLDPHEWAAWIKEATFVYTDSFHGVLFSVKYQKDFLAYYKETIRAPRLLFVAEQLGISSRIIDSSMENPAVLIDEPVDWQDVGAKVSKLKQSSLEYLKRSLSKE